MRAVAGRPVDDELIADTAERIAEIRVSPEGREGIASFLEKRKPLAGFERREAAGRIACSARSSSPTAARSPAA